MAIELATDEAEPRTLITTIVVEVFNGNDFTVRQGDTYADRLVWDEMLGQVVHLTHPAIHAVRYRMWTAEEHAAHEARFLRRKPTQAVPPLALPAPITATVKGPIL